MEVPIVESSSQSHEVPTEVRQSLAHFKSQHPHPLRVAFLMMRLQDSAVHKTIHEVVKKTLAKNCMLALRADDHQFHKDLFWNVLTYIYGCGFGVAVFERIEEESFNPNVAFEVGYMMALGKPVCFLKERTLKALHTDLVGHLYRTFDAHRIEESMPPAIESWIADHEVLSRPYRVLVRLFASKTAFSKECQGILSLLSLGARMTPHEMRRGRGHLGGDSVNPILTHLSHLYDLGLVEELRSGVDVGKHQVRPEVADLVRKFVVGSKEW
jgi:nucleoside 2-deoxyribosyltransferase